MKSWLKIAVQMFKVFIIFTGCTILFYYGIMWLNEEYQDYHYNEEPRGAAVKVNAGGKGEDSSGWLERLILFYLNGE